MLTNGGNIKEYIIIIGKFHNLNFKGGRGREQRFIMGDCPLKTKDFQAQSSKIFAFRLVAKSRNLP